MRIFSYTLLKGSLTRDFQLLLFTNQYPPWPWIYYWSRFEFLRKFANILESIGSSPVSRTPAINDKNFKTKFFHICFRSYWVALIEERFFPKRISTCFIACVVVNSGNKLISGFIVTGDKLSPVTLLYWQLIIAVLSLIAAVMESMKIRA